MSQMSARRFLCSELVTMRRGAVETTVNLESIWLNGATVESEDSVEEGCRIEIRAAAAFFAGAVTSVERHEFGWRIEVEFSALTPWKPDQFRPQHLLDVSE